MGFRPIVRTLQTSGVRSKWTPLRCALRSSLIRRTSADCCGRRSEIDLLGDIQSVVYLKSGISDGALREVELERSQVSLTKLALQEG
jgi:hypothetical protein